MANGSSQNQKNRTNTTNRNSTQSAKNSAGTKNSSTGGKTGNNKKNRKNPLITTVIGVALAAILGLLGRLYYIDYADDTTADEGEVITWESYGESSDDAAESASRGYESIEEVLEDIPAYAGNAYISLNDNTPFFEAGDLTTDAFEIYSDLDDLGRCGTAYANICEEIMPTSTRGSIGSVTPTGWHTVKYDNVDGKYLYNRCHLIGYQLAGENANPKNLITGTRYLNIQGMLPFENMVADYVKETDSHVLYRVTPWFEGQNLVASGVVIEAESVEDKGESILFNVYCYNVQPGITINYADGSSYLTADGENSTEDESTQSYIGSISTKKFHLPTCSSASRISDANKVTFSTREEAIAAGYEPCGKCNP